MYIFLYKKSYYGIMAPLWISIAFSTFGMISTQLLWDENKPNSDSTKVKGTMAGAFNELRKREVLSIGIIESMYQAVVNIYLFSWTPILQNSSETGINVGFIFTCFVVTLILGTHIFEIFMLYLQSDYYKSITSAIFGLAMIFFFVYYVDSFYIRFLLLAAVNGTSGFLNPLMSIIKSRILVEKYRALLMSIFRIPLNAFVIIVLLLVRYMNPFHVRFYKF
jgi:hypothetical protein